MMSFELNIRDKIKIKKVRKNKSHTHTHTVMATPPTPNDATRSNINFRFNGFLQHWRCWHVNNRAAVEVEQLFFF